MAMDDDDLPGDEPAETPAAKPAPKGGSAAAPAKPAAKPDPEPEAAPPKHTHSSKLTRLALEMGYSQADLDDNPSAAIWEDIERVRSLERPAAPAPAAKPEPAKPPVDEDEEYLGQLAEVDPKLARLIKKSLAARDDKALTELREKVAAFEKAEVARQQRAVNAATDAAFAALDEKYLPFVGEGPLGELTDPGQHGWRVAIWKAAGITAEDGKKAIAAKIAAAADKVAGPKVKDEPAPTGYEAAAAARPKKAPPPQDPESGRFTKADFANGHVLRPAGRKAGGVEELSDAETARRVRTEHGVARDRRVAFDDDDDLPE